jgi:outer membrane receptor protein involved in Fe transport
MNFQGREENFRQWSSELRFSSPTGGAIEWMLGLSWQTNAKDNISNSLRPNVRRAQRFNILWEDVTLMNAFATVTFNFLEDRASIDLGARYSDIDKEVFITGYGATWVFDVEPVSTPGYVAVDPATVRFLQPRADENNLWTYPWKDNRNTPDEWYPSTGVEAVGLTFADFPTRLADELDAGVPNHDEFKDSFLDPQVTLRYRVGNNHSVFARWARATKGAGYDTGQTSIPANIDEMKFETEKGETFEIGSKGTVWDGRARYDVTLFRTTFTDLQLSGLAPITDQDSTSISINAGEQRVQGVEFSLTAALTDQWVVNFNGAIMDGEMTDFNGSGCNNEEFYNTLLGLNIPGVLPCDIDNGELTDRTGTQSPRTPDWKFVLTSNYRIPVWDSYEISLNAKGYISDGYITARDSFSSVVRYNQHEDLNLALGFGDQDGVWKLTGYANNIFEARESYNSELDAVPSGLTTLQIPRSAFLTYGLKFNYNFR